MTRWKIEAIKLITIFAVNINFVRLLVKKKEAAFVSSSFPTEKSLILKGLNWKDGFKLKQVCKISRTGTARCLGNFIDDCVGRCVAISLDHAFTELWNSRFWGFFISFCNFKRENFYENVETLIYVMLKGEF